MLSELRGTVNPIMEKVAEPFARAGITPNAITIISLLIGTIAALLFAYRQPLFAGIVLLIGGFFDIIDGAVARLTGQVTDFGGFLDSVIDRYVDFVVIFGVMWASQGALLIGVPTWVWCVLAIEGSIMVSYTRARAEAAGANLTVGIAERAERILILAIFAMLGFTNIAIGLIVLLTHITVLQRVIAAWQRLDGRM